MCYVSLCGMISVQIGIYSAFFFFLSLRLQSELIQYSQSAEGEILIY